MKLHIKKEYKNLDLEKAARYTKKNTITEESNVISTREHYVPRIFTEDQSPQIGEDSPENIVTERGRETALDVRIESKRRKVELNWFEDSVDATPTGRYRHQTTRAADKPPKISERRRRQEMFQALIDNTIQNSSR